MKIAYISCHDYAKYSVGYQDEESLLLDFLLRKGLDIERRVWNDITVDWKQYDVAILKSPWDYHEYIEHFHFWLDTLEASGVRLLNPVETVRWNSDKHYLQDIAKSGMRVIPTLFVERGTTPDLLHYFEQLQAERVILKPCISAGAKNILTIDRDDIKGKQAEIERLLLAESYIVQPFMEEIFAGEWSYIFFNGKFSHCILNVPGDGDFRVQHYHGGSTKAAEAELTHIESATAYVMQFGNGSLYTRVDGIIRNGQFHLMELELIEPYLYLDTHPGVCEHFYSALLHLTDQISIDIPQPLSKDLV
jgi:glutathione synthase/RimK-type ligase-like ATP-grasp enzyme